MGFCSATFKCFLFVLNFFFWTAAAVMLYAGITFLFVHNGSFAEISARPAIILICSGGVLVLGGFIGCFGACCEKKTCLGLYLVFLVSVLIVQASIAGVLLTQRADTKNKFDNFVMDQFQQYGNDTNSTDGDDFNATSFIDLMQSNMECCGYHNYTDWSTLPWGEEKKHSVPISCCNSTADPGKKCNGTMMHKELIYTNGCKAPIDKAYRFFYDFLSYTALALAIFILLGSVIVIGFLYRKRNEPIGYSRMSPAYTEA